jgi:hypothetical protein
MEEYQDPRVRVYPTCCTSAFCGKGPESCPDCPNHLFLREFKRWVEVHAAEVSDPVWCPLVYVATK